MKVLTIVGARPNFVKLAPLSADLRSHFDEVLVNTGQHYDFEMSKIFFTELKLPEPDYNLGVGSGSHARQTGQIIIRLERVIVKEKPSLVIVYGDTNSALGGALCAAKLGITICHIESGMRSYDKIPEEINRVIVDHIADLFFCSTKTAVENLKKEGIKKNVFLVGDVMIDALMDNEMIAEKKSKILKELNLRKKEYMLATVHREENTNDKAKLSSIIEALIESNEKIVLPLHPRTRKYLEAYSLFNKLKSSNIAVVKPLSYINMLMLEKNARKIITDSGGVQKEAYFFNVPCITLRAVTEWKETIENGFNLLVGADRAKILGAIKNFEIRHGHKALYGNGDASKKIADTLIKFKHQNSLMHHK